jgi:ketosteroid isomerase-like protein
MSTSANRDGRTALAPTTLDTSSVEQFDQAYKQAFYEGDYKALTSVYTADAKLMVEDSELIQGRQAIEEFWKSACQRAKAVGMKRTPHSEEREISGDLAYKRGTMTLEIPTKDGGVITHVVKYITIWKREADGVWRVAIDISNRNAPLDPGQFTYGVAVGDQAQP